MNSTHHDKITILNNLAILLSSIWYILIVLSYDIASYYIQSVLSLWLSLNVFLNSSAVSCLNRSSDGTFWERWKKNWRIILIISFIKWFIILRDIAWLQQQKQWNSSFSQLYWWSSLLPIFYLTKSFSLDTSEKTTFQITSRKIDGILHPSSTTISVYENFSISDDRSATVTV